MRIETIEDARIFRKMINEIYDNLLRRGDYGDHDRNIGLYDYRRALFGRLRRNVAENVFMLLEKEWGFMGEHDTFHCPVCETYITQVSTKADVDNRFFCVKCGKKFVINTEWNIIIIDRKEEQ